MSRTTVADLFTFGEALALFLAEDTDSVVSARKFDLQVVGAEANVAVAVSRLGLSSIFQTRVGLDELGDVIIGELLKEKIDVSRIRRVDNYTGAIVRNRGTSQPVNVTYLRTSSAASTMTPRDIEASDIEECRWLHVTGITAAISQSACATVAEALNIGRAAETMKSFDLNIRRKLWSETRAREVLYDLVQNIDVVFGGADEYQVVWGSDDPKTNLQNAVNRGIKTAIMTAGPALIRVLSDGEYFEVSPPLVTAIDPVGSGDAFVGGTIAGLLAGLELERAVVQGSECGASVATQIGDWIGLPYGIAGRRIDTSEREPTS
ncbi:MAG TPA: sugar kinase [Candidatus Paceibacterota bacterium]|nr:sugar kinase [Candidatus Paceibacterota bacterium]